MSSVVLSGDTSGAITVAAPAVAGTNTITLPAATGTVALTSGSAIAATTLSIGGTALGAGNASIMKNRIINGAMVIDQRNAGASVNNVATYKFGVDRWQFYGSNADKYSFQQSSTAPAGFATSTKITSLAATTVGSDVYMFRQQIEGYNVADLNFGSANAKTVTLSFWVNCSLTGTFGGSITNKDSVRSYPFTYTISSANTWEQKSITIAGDTSGTWQTTNDTGLQVWLGLGVGSANSGTAGAWATASYWSATGATNFVSTSGATLYITGVQLEVGSSATGYEYRMYGTELALCQRYFQSWGGNTAYEYIGIGQANSTTAGQILIPALVSMRASPTLTTSGSFVVTSSTGAGLSVTGFSLDQSGTQSYGASFTVASGLTAGNVTRLSTNNSTSPRLTLSAEL